MGQEISTSEFNRDDYIEFTRRLRLETKLLFDWFDDDNFTDEDGVCGLELEACIVDKNYLPSPCNSELLERVDSLFMVPELAKFNIEFNSNPYPIGKNVFQHLLDELNTEWTQCQEHAEKMDKEVIAIGILPTIQNEIISLDTISSLQRFIAIDNQLKHLRKNKPIRIDIMGNDHLSLIRNDIMLEAAATSLQIHLQVNPKRAARFYNAAHILSAPMVALTGNSPYLFSKDLWNETRIPMFEQAVSAIHYCDTQEKHVNRVTFGTGYAKNSLRDPFLENLISYPPLLPLIMEDSPHWLSHLRLHNGTIWRWNRPIIGLTSTGKPHLRIEHRIPSSGPSAIDCIANVAFYLGLVYDLALRNVPPESKLTFERARNNFYNAAQHGLYANIEWVNGHKICVNRLIVDALLPVAKASLHRLGVDESDIKYYLDDVIKNRVLKAQTGSSWQRAYIAKHGKDFKAMTHAYVERQKCNIPIHEWTL